MNRPMIMLAAMASAALAVTSACLAEARPTERPFRPDGLAFALSRGDQAGRFNLTLRDDRRSHLQSSRIAPAELSLGPNALDRDGPITIALVREAGRVDCNGTVRGAAAAGTCRFTADAGFNAELARTGIRQPSAEESYAMTHVGVGRALVRALATARYPTPDVDQLIALTAVGVDPAYIRDLSARGYRPSSLDDLVAFRAVGVTPDYVDGLRRAGARIDDGDEIVAMRAMGVTPEFVAGFARIGYAGLDSDRLVELRALGVTPAMVQAIERGEAGVSLPQREIARNLVAQRRR